MRGNTILTVAVAALAQWATAGQSVNVKVTGSGGDYGHGYYVEYQINGTTYRSDKIGQKINAIAWDHMSDADRKTTLNAFGGMKQIRAAQFGEDMSKSMAEWYNQKKGWTEAANILKARLVEKDFPGLQERFRDSQAYFAANFMPANCTEDQIKHFPETKKLYDAEREIFSWACAAYQAMEQAEYKRTQVAVQSVSGDLISLICDKVLVPNITPSGAGTLGAQVFGEVLEYLDKSTGYCDKVIDMVVGHRVTADMATEVMAAMANTIDCQYEIIKLSLARCHELQNEISTKYAELAAAEAASQSAHSQVWAEANRRITGEATTGEPDATIKAANEEKSQAVAAAQAELSRFADPVYSYEHGGGEGERAAQAALDAARAAKLAYNQAQYDDLHARYLTFKSKYQDAAEDDLACKPQNVWNGLTDQNAMQLFFYNQYNLNATAGDVAAMRADLARQQQERREFGASMSAWNTNAGEELVEARKAYRELYTDWAALSLDGVVRNSDDFGAGGRTILGRMEDGYGENHGSYCAVDYEDVIAAENEKLEDFVQRCAAYQETYVPAILTRYKAGVKQYTDAVAEYDAAWAEMNAALDGLPSYVQSQKLAPGAALLIDNSSELAQRFLAPGATGTLDEALAVRGELASRGAAYRKASARLEAAKVRVQACAAAFGKYNSLYSRWQNNYQNYGTTAATKFTKFSEISQNYHERSLSSVQSHDAQALMALERDFDNHTYTHCELVDELGDLDVNRELYSTNILEEASDPYVRVSYSARCYSRASDDYYTPWGIAAPGYYAGRYSVFDEFKILAGERSRGTCSYSYHIAGYAAATGGIASDPYDDYIKPLLDEIDAVRAGQHVYPVYPGPGEIDPPLPPINPTSGPAVSVLQEAEISEGVAVAKAATVAGVLLDETGAVAGSVELKVGKAGKKGSKLSGSMQLLGGKKISLKSGYYDLASGAALVALSGKGIAMSLKVGSVGGSDGIAFAGTQGAYAVSSAAVGGAMARSSGLAAYVDPAFALGVEGEILVHEGVAFVPFGGEPIALKGAKWTFGKAASIKFAKAKGSKDKTKVLQGYDDPKKPNLSGMKLTYTAKKGTFKGSFKVYALQGPEGKQKLKKYTVNVEGIVVDGQGFGKATCKKPAAGPFDVSVR